MKPRKIQKIIPVPGTEMTLPVTEIIGAKAGGTITLSAGVHSREYIGVQALIELSQEIDPASQLQLSGIPPTQCRRSAPGREESEP